MKQAITATQKVSTIPMQAMCSFLKETVMSIDNRYHIIPSTIQFSQTEFYTMRVLKNFRKISEFDTLDGTEIMGLR